MALISLQNASKSYAHRALFEDISFSIEDGEHVGLIGPNGAGKSTLLRILAGRETADDGRVIPRKGLRIGFLEQVPSFRDGATVESAIRDGLEGDHLSGGDESHALVAEQIAKLSLSSFSPGQPVILLSGGWRKRVALARELIRRPEILLLDEPTNHLDVESIYWLEELLARSDFATLTVTHDRLFLQRVATRILELDRRNPKGLLSVRGTYADYLETKEQLLASRERQEQALRNTLRRETEWLRRGPKARTTKQQARIQRAEGLQRDVADLEARNQSRTAGIDFQQSRRLPKKLLEAKCISKSYGGRVLFEGFDLTLSPGSRIGLLGRNGCGKSTLIRVLLGQEKPDSGDIFRSEQFFVAYFEQNRESLDPNATVAKTLAPAGDQVVYRGNALHIRSYLDRFLFTRIQADMPVAKLSGGEQSRLLIAKLMLTEASVLVLDEPTNDLDLATLDILQGCLEEFSGSVLLVTHDRYFLDAVSNKILAFPLSDEGPRTLLAFADLAQWEEWREAQRGVSKPQVDSSPRPTPPPPAKPQKSKKRSYKDQLEFDSMESRIHEAESALERLTAEAEENASNAARLVDLTRQIEETRSEIDRLYARWAELE
ncbi:MAG TPA: ABC-F family ATP-binding cassette domain-containing protein [bacterium]|nr:ABC-F family ATP-binding cassette domain-containing protein [bacterium]